MIKIPFLALLLAPTLAWSASDFEETKSQAENGEVRAQTTLAIMYNKGEGVSQDYAEAIRW